MDNRKAYKQHVLLGKDADGNIYALSKDGAVELPPHGAGDCRDLLTDLTLAGGLLGKGASALRLVDAAIVGGGRYQKRRTFKADYKAAKKEPLSAEQQAKADATAEREAKKAKEREGYLEGIQKGRDADRKQAKEKRDAAEKARKAKLKKIDDAKVAEAARLAKLAKKGAVK